MTDKKLDTGTGGIEIDGKVYTYDVGVERDVVDDGDWNSGDINVDKQKRDLSKGTKITLGQYMSHTTSGKTDSVPDQAAGTGNRYTLGAAMQELSTTNPDGTPRGPTYYQYEESFEPDLGPHSFDPEDDNRPTLPRGEWFSNNKISRGMVRSKGSDKIDGNDLLRFDLKNGPENIPSIEPNHPVATYSNSILKNRWTSDNRFKSDASRESTKDRFAASNYLSGRSFTPEEYIQPPQDVKMVSQRQLAAIGSVLMARASGEPNSTSQNLDPTSSGFTNVASIIPGTPQLSAERVSELVLQAKDVILNLDAKKPGTTDDNYISITPTTSTAENLQSWGALNNPYDRFTGISSFGMQVLAISFVIAIGLIPSLVTLFTSTGQDREGFEVKDAFGRFPMGAWRRRGGSYENGSTQSVDVEWFELLGFKPTVYPLGECITTGVLVFYGLYTPRDQEKGAGSVGGISPLTAVSLRSPESYVVFSRAIFRSFLRLIDEFANAAITPPFTAAGGSPVAAVAAPFLFVQQILSLLNSFKTSKLMSIINIFAQLGDQAFSDFGRLIDKNALGIGLKKSKIDFIPASHPKSEYEKSRLLSLEKTEDKGEKNLRHAWSAFRASDLLIMPSSLVSARAFDNNLGVPHLLPSIETDEFVGIKPIVPGEYLFNGIYATTRADEDRIDSALRTQMEANLDAEYMPFYFHDVRTNEIVSFHAFLTNLNDSYQAQYDTSEAFGRVEPIKTYKGTNRKLDFGFQIAALSQEDFDSIWLKINKLTTLVYPQFTAGRTVYTEKFTVTMPFSQQYAASPMVRVRLGDFIHSNYSRFNLARLFGYGYENSEVTNKDSKKLKSEKFTKFAERNAERNKKWQEAIDAEKVVKGNKFFWQISPSDEQFKKLGVPKPSVPMLFEVIGEKKYPTRPDTTYVIGRLVPGTADDDPIFEDGVKYKAGKNYLGYISNLTDDAVQEVRLILDAKYLRPTTKINKKLGTLDMKSQSEDIEDSESYQAAFESFMSPENNSIVRSFESAGGRGLAGFIESMTFDWYSATQWETRDGFRAPKMCKVTVSFSPMHDIAPGLDHKGANRAPIYPVGPMRPSKLY